MTHSPPPKNLAHDLSAGNLRAIREALQARGKHANYQRLPDFLPASLLSNILHQGQHLEKERLVWMRSKIDFENKSVLEIGANTGYFGLMLAQENDARVYAYEPFSPHAEFIKILVQAYPLEKKVTVIEQAVTLESIAKLPKVDVLLLLNVIQHAGYDFEMPSQEIDKDGWLDYSIQYLSKLRIVSKTMLFQMGYTLGGVAGKLCKDKEIFAFTTDLLQRAGWRTTQCGMVKQLPLLADKVEYCDVDNDYSRYLSNTFPLRIASKFLSRLAQRRQLTTRRFAQRPIFLCNTK